MKTPLRFRLAVAAPARGSLARRLIVLRFFALRFHVFGFLVLGSLLLGGSLAGCDRGDHPGQIGQAAHDFTVTDRGRTVRLSQFRGKVVVLNFWATWCSPCLEELPSLMELQRATPGVQVLAVSIDDDPEAYEAFLKQYEISLVSVRDGSQGANLHFGSVRVPETFVIDRSGVIRRKFIGAQQWTNPEIEGYLARL